MKTKEIEIKWFADNVKREEFLEFMMQQIKKTGTTKWGYLTVFGPDYYWRTDNKWIGAAVDAIVKLLDDVKIDHSKLAKGDFEKILKHHAPQNVVRHRVSPDFSQLTAKARLGDRHIRVRQEEEVMLESDTKQSKVDRLLSLLGMKHAVTVKKDCDIYTIQTSDGAKIDVVWYQTYVDGFDDKVFIEVEVNNLPEEKALEVLEQWQNQMRYHLNLTNDLISDDSLYEIFTGHKYKKV